MKDIKVKKTDLLVKLRENLKEHQAIFDEAVVGYKSRAVELLEDHIARIKRGKLERVHVMLPVPENHKSDYERVIAMLEMSVDDTIEIPESEFQAYVMDDWAWKQQFLTASAEYSSMARGKLDQ